MIEKLCVRRAAVLAASALMIATVPVVSIPVAQAQVAHGAIAYSSNGANGRSWGFASRGAAERTALNYCGFADCSVLASFIACGAVAFNGDRYQGGYGPDLASAQNDAINSLGGGWLDSWVCN